MSLDREVAMLTIDPRDALIVAYERARHLRAPARPRASAAARPRAPQLSGTR
jgi:hypothetical protein